MLALRVGRRRTTWESNEIDKIIRTEFWGDNGEVDLEISVYRVEQTDVLRTVAEHCAGLGVTTRGFPNLNLEAGRLLDETPGETGFSFTVAAHRDLRFASEGELREFLSKAIIPEATQRTHKVERSQMVAYARDRAAAGDPEWVSFFERNPRWPKE